MACEDFQKVACCIYIHSYVRTKFGFLEDPSAEDVRTKQKRLVYCKLSCPEDCANIGGPEGEGLWVEQKTATDCANCDSSDDGCEKNVIVTFDLNTCEVTEHMLSAEEYSSVNFPATTSILYNEKCVTGPFSVSQPEKFRKLVADAQSRAGCSTTGSCCYVVRNEAGVELVSCRDNVEEADCDAAKIQQSINVGFGIRSVSTITSVRFSEGQSCSDVDCSDMPKNQNGYCLRFDESTGEYTCQSSTAAACYVGGQFFATLQDCESNIPDTDPGEEGACCFSRFDETTGERTSTCYITTRSQCESSNSVGSRYAAVFLGAGTLCNDSTCGQNPPENPNPPKPPTPPGNPSPDPPNDEPDDPVYPPGYPDPDPPQPRNPADPKPPTTPGDPQPPVDPPSNNPVEQRDTRFLSVQVPPENRSEWRAGRTVKIYDNNNVLQHTVRIKEVR